MFKTGLVLVKKSYKSWGNISTMKPESFVLMTASCDQEFWGSQCHLVMFGWNWNIAIFKVLHACMNIFDN